MASEFCDTVFGQTTFLSGQFRELKSGKFWTLEEIFIFGGRKYAFRIFRARAFQMYRKNIRRVSVQCNRAHNRCLTQENLTPL